MKEHTIYLWLMPCGKFAKLGKYFRKSKRCLQFEISLTEKNVIRYDTLQADNIPVQESALKEWKKQNKYDYSAARAYLKEIGLEDDRGFIYGIQWLARPIPQEDVSFLEGLIVEWAEGER